MNKQLKDYSRGKWIAGVRLETKKVFEDRRGAVMHGLIPDENTPIGEVYFSSVKPMALKAWHLHTEMTLRYLCVKGSVYVGLYDDRYGSPTRFQSMLLRLGQEGGCVHGMLTIPPGVWNGFQSALPMRSATICNIASHPHDPNEIQRLAPDQVPWHFDWPRIWFAGG